jgi:hypothetical protein
MRVKTNAIFEFGPAREADNKTVRDYRNEYKALSTYFLNSVQKVLE